MAGPSGARRPSIPISFWTARITRRGESPRGYIRRFFADEPIRIVFGAMRDKAVEEVTGTLFPLAAEVILTAPAQPRAFNPHSLAETIDHPNIRIAANIDEALRMTREKPMTTFV